MIMTGIALENLFGTNEALGVSYLTEDGKPMTIAEFEASHSALGDAMPYCKSIFPDGSSAVCCTNFAIQIYRKLPSRVQIFGFANEDNPTSRIAREEIHPNGHDFAIVDQRYLVDPWIRQVAGKSDQIVFDWWLAEDFRSIVEIYGMQTCWRHMVTTERIIDDAARKAA